MNEETRLQIARVIFELIAEGRPVTEHQRNELLLFISAPNARRLVGLEGSTTLVRVYRLPADKLTYGYCFGGGMPITFQNVDWFEAPVDLGREALVAFIKGKKYFKPDARFLVLGDHPALTFTIDPTATEPGGAR
jgi:hypothetical protein